MTDRELLVHLAAGYMASCAHPGLEPQKVEHDIKDSVAYAVGALAAIDEHFAATPTPKTTPKQDDPLKIYPWAIDTDGDGCIRDTRRRGEFIVMSSHALFGKWKSWRTPAAEARDYDISDTRDEAIASVDWPKWNVAPEDKP